MKLYREVKASERLPDRDGRYSVKYKKGFGPLTNPYDYMYFDPINPQWDEIESWLEPIEITEEEWLIGYVDYASALISYAVLLGKELDETASLAHIHGWRSTRAEEGKSARKKLDALAKSLLLPPFTEALSKLKGDG